MLNLTSPDRAFCLKWSVAPKLHLGSQPALEGPEHFRAGPGSPAIRGAVCSLPEHAQGTTARGHSTRVRPRRYNHIRSAGTPHAPPGKAHRGERRKDPGHHVAVPKGRELPKGDSALSDTPAGKDSCPLPPALRQTCRKEMAAFWAGGAAHGGIHQGRRGSKRLTG